LPRVQFSSRKDFYGRFWQHDAWLRRRFPGARFLPRPLPPSNSLAPAACLCRPSTSRFLSGRTSPHSSPRFATLRRPAAFLRFIARTRLVLAASGIWCVLRHRSSSPGRLALHGCRLEDLSGRIHSNGRYVALVGGASRRFSLEPRFHLNAAPSAVSCSLVARIVRWLAIG